LGCPLPGIKLSGYSFAMRQDWWWLRVFGVQLWSAEERRARIALGMAGSVVWLLSYLIVEEMFDEYLGMDAHVAAPLSFFLTMVPSYYAARPIGRELFPKWLVLGDKKARERLGKNDAPTN
jgi:hypothetical protein